MNDSRRCTAHSSQTGERCKKSAMLGQTVCRVHGGSAPQSKKAARERLNDLVDPAISTLRTILKQGVKTGDYAAAVRASIAILDRCGFHPSQIDKDGDPNQGGDLIQVESLSLPCRRLIFAELRGFKLSAELEHKMLSEISNSPS